MVSLKRKIATKISRYGRDTNKITRVKYHDTCVVEFNKDWILLRTGGWRTPTTKARMNHASREFDLGFSVFQKNNSWYVEYNGEVVRMSGENLTIQRPRICCVY